MRLHIGIASTTLVIAAAVALAAAPVAHAARPTSCTGGSRYTTPGGNEVQFGAGAVKNPQGAVAGQGNVQIKDAGFEAHYEVLDLLVMDNTCWILGEITRGDSGVFAPDFLGAQDLTGFRFVTSLQDNGEGAGADPDLVGGNPYWDLPYFPFDASTCTFEELDEACIASIADLPFGAGILFFPLVDLTAGNIQVNH